MQAPSVVFIGCDVNHGILLMHAKYYFKQIKIKVKTVRGLKKVYVNKMRVKYGKFLQICQT